MSAHQDAATGTPQEILEAFLAEHSKGSGKQLDEWLQVRLGNAANPELISEVHRLHRAAEVLRIGLPAGLDPGDGSRSFFRRRRDEWAPELTDEPLDLGRLAPGHRVAHFTLVRFIAKGGMGQVWEALDEKLRSRVALKLVLPERLDTRALELFAREARAGGRLTHPNIVSTRGFDVDEGWAWIAQELVEGSWTLKDFLDELRAADQVPKDYYPRVAWTVAQVADALQAAHDAGVIHRDVKPANILIAPDETPKLTDFGLARVSDDPLVSLTGDFAGTWSYMSPEQVTAKRMGLDHRSDVFSLGVVLYELLALRRPFEGDTTHQIAEKIIAYDPPDASRVRSQCPRELAVICGKALEKLPGHRYATAGEFAADLRRHLANQPIEARPPGPATRARKWVRRNPEVSSAGLVGALAMIVVTGLLIDRSRAARDMRALATAEIVQRRIAEESHEDVMRLSAQANLEDLVERQKDLWPAIPDRIPEFQAWIDEAGELIARRSEHERQLAEVRLAALPPSAAAGASPSAMSPARAEWKAVRGELDARTRALEAWRTGQVPAAPALPPDHPPVEAIRDHARAWAMVAPERSEFGAEELGLALALECLASAPEELAAPLWNTVAWGRIGRGDAAGARAASRAALASAGESRQSI